MKKDHLPLPSLAEWRPTRDTIQVYSQVLGKIRRARSPAQKHWGHASLKVVEQGLSTTAIPFPGRAGESFELLMDLTGHRQRIGTSLGEWKEINLIGNSTQGFMEACLAILAGWGIEPDIDRSLFADPRPRAYVPEHAEAFWQSLKWMDGTFKRFKQELPGKTGPVQLWPHNFDLALMWLSGRTVPGFELDDEENADEQISFGFSTGDEDVPNAYLYVTVYPWQAALIENPLPGEAVWHTEGWKGALLMVQTLARDEDPEEYLLEFFRAVFRPGSALMR